MGSVLISTVVSHRRKTINRGDSLNLNNNNNSIVCSKFDNNKSESSKKSPHDCYFQHHAELFFKESVKIGKINKFVDHHHRGVDKKQVVGVNNKVKFD